ncbi:MAG TPA: hypothetical protein VGW11_01480 [Solirubrobacteraceae bacterium]|nr:hypothetical protein [Solirubrobacteraceae bacterium]
MDPEELERIAHELERLSSTPDLDFLLGRLEALGGTVEAEVVRAALGHLPDERVAGELQREIARRLRRGLE